MHILSVKSEATVSKCQKHWG